jgi:hypothetical protein
MEMDKSKVPIIAIDDSGFLIRGLIAYLAQQSAFLIGQLP